MPAGTGFHSASLDWMVLINLREAHRAGGLFLLGLAARVSSITIPEISR